MPSGRPPSTREQNLARFWAKVDKSGECWFWTASKDELGYGKFGVGRKGRWLAHRFIFTQLNGPVLPGLFVCHHCDEPRCVRPEHLFAGTPADNSRDASQKGRLGKSGQPGERNGMARLTDAEVVELRAQWTGWRGQGREMALRYGVSTATISRALRAITYAAPA